MRTVRRDGSWCEPACPPYGNVSLVREADAAEYANEPKREKAETGSTRELAGPGGGGLTGWSEGVNPSRGSDGRLDGGLGEGLNRALQRPSHHDRVRQSTMPIIKGALPQVTKSTRFSFGALFTRAPLGHINTNATPYSSLVKHV